MEFGILGPLEVRDGSGLVRVPGAKERALLADLLVHAGRVVSADRLVEDLWGEHRLGNPANALQGRVSALRRALGPAGPGVVVTRPPGYVLEAGPEGVDAARFQRLVAEAEAADLLLTTPQPATAALVLVGRAVRDRLDPDAYRSARAAGRELGVGEALRLALG